MAGAGADDSRAGSDERTRAEAGAEQAEPKVYQSSGPKPPMRRSKEPPEGSGAAVTRRKVVWWMFGAFMLAQTFAAIRFFFPRVLFEPPTKVRIGYPSDFHTGVDTRFQRAERIWVVKSAEGIFVILARCTHLGCTPNWVEPERKFKCPCHGSGFDSEGVNFEGPAPRPLDRCQVQVDAGGQIVVDKAQTFQAADWEETRDQWLLRA